MCYSILIIIVNRGKGSHILKFARAKGASDASCILGQGTVNNRLLQIIEMNDVEKEIILIVVPTEREAEILDKLNSKFHFEKKNHGIAFTMPLAGVMKMKCHSLAKWQMEDFPQNRQWEHIMMLIIVDKGEADNVIQISQDAGYYGGTVIKGYGCPCKTNAATDIVLKPEKEAVLMLVESKRANRLEEMLNHKLNLNRPDTGSLLKAGVSKTIGLFNNDKQGEDIK